MEMKLYIQELSYFKLDAVNIAHVSALLLFY
jgi:hypothetical protein